MFFKNREDFPKILKLCFEIFKAGIGLILLLLFIMIIPNYCLAYYLRSSSDYELRTVLTFFSLFTTFGLYILSWGFLRNFLTTGNPFKGDGF